MKITEIRKDIKKKLNTCINETANETDNILHEELDDFYLGKIPDYYNRTGTLGTSPEVTDIYCDGLSAGLTAKLNNGISYKTGSFSGGQVIDAAEHHTYGIVGNGGFWERSKDRIQDAVDKTIGKNF